MRLQVAAHLVQQKPKCADVFCTFGFDFSIRSQNTVKFFWYWSVGGERRVDVQAYLVGQTRGIFRSKLRISFSMRKWRVRVVIPGIV